jgi:hypothetical protein
MAAEDYSTRAEFAERQARNARNAAERSTFLEIARLWRDLAGRAPKASSGNGGGASAR